MNKRTAAKIFIDASMLVLYLQLTFFYTHNTLYHEVTGILVGVVFVVHIAFNIQEGKSLIRNKRVLPLVMDALLIISMALCIISGLLVARDLFVGPGNTAIAWVHCIAAYVGLGAIAVHLLLHAKYLVSVFVSSSKESERAGSESNSDEKAAQLSRREFAKKAALVGAGIFAAGSFVVLEMPRLRKLSQEESEAVSTYVHAGGSDKDKNQPVGKDSVNTAEDELSDSADNEESSKSKDLNASSDNEAPSAQNENNSDTSDIRCTLCRKNCPLSDLKCQRGVEWAVDSGYL